MDTPGEEASAAAQDEGPAPESPPRSDEPAPTGATPTGATPTGATPTGATPTGATSTGDGPTVADAVPTADGPAVADAVPTGPAPAGTGAAPETQIGVPADPHAVPQYPGQRYPAAPGHPGEPPIPATWPPPYAPTAPYAQPPPGGWPPPPAGQPHPPGAPGQTAQFGAHGWTYAAPAGHPAAPARPKRRGGVVVALVLVATVALAALIGGGVLIFRTLGGPAVPADFRTVETPYLRYSVPRDWPRAGDHLVQAFGVSFEGGADAAAYVCRGDPYLRGTVASALAIGGVDAETIARDFAVQFGTVFYTSMSGTTPRIDVMPARGVTVGDSTGSVVEVRATTPADDGCLATTGSVSVLAVPVPQGTALLLVNGDVAGGPASPPAVDEDTLRTILDTARPAQR